MKRIINQDYKLHFYLVILFGIFSTAFNYFGYGVSDQIEQLPILIRSLDKSFLTNDFFTNAASESISRFYYSKIVSFISGSESNLSIVCLLLTFLSNILISLITYLFTKKFFNESSLSGVVASALVMSVNTFGLGWSSIIYSVQPLPSSLAIPFILGAIFSFSIKKYRIGMIICGIGSIIHPLFGLEICGILFITLFIIYIINFQNQEKRNSNFRELVICGCILLLFACISIVPQITQTRIDSNQYINILAFFRHPHHYVPSTFGLKQWIEGSVFFLASLSLFLESRSFSNSQARLIMSIVVLTVLLLCVGGYFFVEIIPIRIWVTAQTYRLLFLLKWFGVILSAEIILNNKYSILDKILFIVSLLHPIAFGIFIFLHNIKEIFIRINYKHANFIDPFITLLILAILFEFRQSLSLFSIVYLVLYILFIFFQSYFSKKTFIFISISFLFILTMLITFHNQIPFTNHIKSFTSITNSLNSKMNSELGSTAEQIANFARQKTPEDSVFLTPPLWGQFRLLARRAIVVDFKAFPFSDSAISEWYDRITSCYGKVTSNSDVDIIKLLEINYQNINDNTLLELQKKYQFSYAILYSQTPTNLKVVFSNSQFKVVQFFESLN